MTLLIEELGTQADVVLFDAPPVLMVADTMVLASQVDGTMLAVRSRSTRREVAARAVERLDSVQARVLGVVLNKVQNRQYVRRENKHR
jgi:Mrp family chromosome partitioning ATPase